MPSPAISGAPGQASSSRSSQSVATSDSPISPQSSSAEKTVELRWPKPSASSSRAQVVPSKVSQSLSIPSSGLSGAAGQAVGSSSSQSTVVEDSPASAQS